LALVDRLNELNLAISQCDSLIATAHKLDAAGLFLFSQKDREQIASAAFLNSFIAWEAFLEAAFADYLIGEPSLSGAAINKFAHPATPEAAKSMLIGVNKYFDYSNHEFVKRISRIYFQNGHPFDAPIGSVVSDLADLKTIRNACAHLTSTTQAALEAVALRIFGSPRVGITPYVLILSPDPRSATGGTVYSEFRDKLIATATVIANG
jgi:hypothetical protein